MPEILCLCDEFELWYIDDTIPEEEDVDVCKCGHPSSEHLRFLRACTGILVTK